MVVDSWNRVNEDNPKDDKKYDYKSLGFEKAFISEVDAVSNESSNIENGVYKPTTVKAKKSYAQIGIGILAALLCLLIIWLAVLTVLREQQIRTLKDNLRDVRADVDMLKKRFLEDDLIDDVKAFEDAIYADPTDDDSSGGPSGNNDFFLNGDAPTMDMTEEDLDDDDLLAESGDWAYDDEDQDDDEDKGIKVGFDLPEGSDDLLGDVMEGRIDIDGDTDDEDMINRRKILKIMKDDSITDAERTKREVIAHTKDGVMVLSEPYGVARLRNDSVSPDERTRVYKALHSSSQQPPKMLQDWDEKRKAAYPKKYDASAAEVELTKSSEANVDMSTSHPSLSFRNSRVMTTDEEKHQPPRRIARVRRPMLKSGDYANSEIAVNHRRRRPLNANGRRNLDSLENLEDVDIIRGPMDGPIKQGIAAHFNGDTTGYIVGQHEHYDGNGRLRHPHDTPYAAWKAAPWVRLTAAERYFRLGNDGSVTILDDGIYLIYAQILYHDEHDTNSYKVYRTDGTRDETLLQCTTTVHSTSRMEKASTCFTSAAVHLRAGDRISLKNIGSMRYSIMEPAKSFFGFVKLGDLGRQ